MNYIANPLIRVSVSQGLESEDWDLKMWTPRCPTAHLVATAHRLSSEWFNALLKKCNADKQ